MRLLFAFFLSLIPSLALAQGFATVGIPPSAGYPSYVANDTRYYPISVATSVVGPTANTASTLYCAPTYVQVAMHWDSIAANVSTVGTTNVQLAVYTDEINSSGYHQPNTLISNTTSLSDTSTGGITGALGSAGVGVAIPAGLNWVCQVSNDSTVKLDAYGSGFSYITTQLGTATATNATGVALLGSLTYAGTFGTWPTLGSTSMTEQTGFAISAAYRIATIP
jgi:hypothetical protein